MDQDTPTKNSEPTASGLQQPAAPVTTPPNPTPAPEAPPQQNRPTRRPGFTIVVTVLLVVAAVAVVAFNYYTNRQTRNAAAPTKKDVALIRVGFSFPPPTAFYPTMVTSTNSLDVNHQLFEGLTGYIDGTKIMPLLASGWTNPDTNTWIFALHHGVKFHDGNTMTAKQVKASLDQQSASDYGQEFGSTISRVDVVDDYTVKITTDGPDSLLPNKLSYLDIYDTDSPKPSDAGNGTGPYILKPGTTPSTSQLDLVASPSYWGGHVYTREIDYTAYSGPDAIMAALAAGKLDIGGDLRETQVSKLDTTIYEPVKLGGTEVGQLVPNTLRGGPLAKASVRRAIWQALDPNALLKALGRTGSPASQIVPSEIPGNDPKLTRPATDPAAAKQAIAAAGYPNGFAFTLTYYSPSNDNLAAEIKRQLKLAGVTVNLDPQTEGAALVAKALGGKTDMYYNTQTSDLLDGSDLISNYVKQKTYDNPSLDALYDQTSQTLDPAKRLKLLQEMSDFVYNDMPTIPVYNVEVQQIAVRRSLGLQTTYQELGGDPGLYFARVYAK